SGLASAVKSHSFTVLSRLSDANVLLSGENATSSMKLPCPTSDFVTVHVLTSHNRIVRSPLPVAMSLPSGEKTSAPLHEPIFNSGSASPVSASQTATFLKVPVARIFPPSGENATRIGGAGRREPSFAGCSLRVINCLPVLASQSFTVSSWLAVATFLPSGEN